MEVLTSEICAYVSFEGTIGPFSSFPQTYCMRTQPGDLILVVSDGVHDNLHPILLGVKPMTLKLNYANWEQAKKACDVEEVAARYRTQRIENLLEEIPVLTPQSLTEKVISHCLKVTNASRNWMEANKTKKLPVDYTTYPGKMDHTTCAVVRVGVSEQETQRG